MSQRFLYLYIEPDCQGVSKVLNHTESGCRRGGERGSSVQPELSYAPGGGSSCTKHAQPFLNPHPVCATCVLFSIEILAKSCQAVPQTHFSRFFSQPFWLSSVLLSTRSSPYGETLKPPRLWSVVGVHLDKYYGRKIKQRLFYQVAITCYR